MVDDVTLRAQARIGQVLRERYRLDAILGVGGMAVVYLATHRNKKRFAVKILLPEIAARADTRERFVREGYAANTVDHPGAVAVIDDDVTEDGAPFLVMELLDGEEVGLLAERNNGVLPIPAVLAVTEEVLAVLEAAHAKGVVHRDLKPANLFVTRDGAVKVLDFGIARLREGVGGPNAPSLTRTGALMGTPAFMPPEQAVGHMREVDAQSDLWALGATMFTLLTGRYVHEAESTTQLIILAATQPARSLGVLLPGAPTPLVQLVDRALAFEKAARWPSAASMRTATREARRAIAGQTQSRETLAELFGIGSWETKAQALVPPPGVSLPLTPPPRVSHHTAPMPGASRPAYPTAPMPRPATTGNAVAQSLTAPPPANRHHLWVVVGVLFGLMAAAAGFALILLTVMRHDKPSGPTAATGALAQPSAPNVPTPDRVAPAVTSAAASALPSATPSARPVAVIASASVIKPSASAPRSSGCKDGVMPIIDSTGETHFIPCK